MYKKNQTKITILQRATHFSQIANMQNVLHSFKNANYSLLHYIINAMLLRFIHFLFYFFKPIMWQQYNI